MRWARSRARLWRSLGVSFERNLTVFFGFSVSSILRILERSLTFSSSIVNVLFEGDELEAAVLLLLLASDTLLSRGSSALNSSVV